MVSTKWVCRSGQSIFFTYFSRNHFNTFLLINKQKTKTCLKQNIVAKAISSATKI